jgi:hypothetical protein
LPLAAKDFSRAKALKSAPALDLRDDVRGLGLGADEDVAKVDGFGSSELALVLVESLLEFVAGDRQAPSL